MESKPDENEEIIADLGLNEDICVDCTTPGDQPEPYPTWDSNNSRVISGPLGAAKYPGRAFATWTDAKTYAEGKYHVIKFWVFGHRWMARIKRV